MENEIASAKRPLNIIGEEAVRAVKNNRDSVGIITYSDSLNWGAQLQAFALKEAIQNNGFDAYQIDHRRMNLSQYRKGRNISVIIGNLIAFLKRESFKIRVERTLKWREQRLNLTSPCYNSEDMAKLNEQYQVFITGSDQVWNCTHGINPNFYLDFVVDDSKKCSYAASFGIKHIPTQYLTDVCTRLNKYRYISVREKTGQEIVKKCCDKDVDTVCDPVFLLDALTWKRVISQSSDVACNLNSKYIFVYATQTTAEFAKAVYKIKRATKLPVVTVSWLPGCKTVKDLGPAEFVNYIMNAEMVVTTSFHATAFSIIFKKNFYVYPHSTTGNRVTDLLSRLQISDRIIDDKWNEKICEVDYNPVLPLLHQYVEHSKDVLLQMLSGKRNIEKANNITKIGNSCTGCGVCSKVCPFDCITLIENKEGFIYPSINSTLCRNCGICIKNCHVVGNKSNNGDAGFYGYAKNENLRREGSSGGAFSAIVETVAKYYSNLWIFGSIFDSKNVSVHQAGFQYPNYKELCQSKYVFSNACNTFDEVKKLLEQGAFVIYCGTPCQIGALKAYLKIDYEKLLLLDFICHGVPSEKFMREHVKYISKGRAIDSLEFRSKAMGWGLHKYCLKATDSNGKVIYLQKAGKDFFFSHFLKNDCLRMSCYQCRYSRRHVSDITLGDFWEVSKYDSKMNDERGVSVLFTNNQKGIEFAKLLDCEMMIKKLPCEYHRSHCGTSSEMLQSRASFYNKMNQYGISSLEKRFKSERPIIIIKKFIKKVTN